MSSIVAATGATLLRAFSNFGLNSSPDVAAAYATRSKLEVLFGATVWSEIANKVVLDFGCGPGLEAVEMAEHGAARVIGIDLRAKWLRDAEARAATAGVSHMCEFHQSWDETVDVILCVDCFEHFADPAGALRQMRTLLRPGGSVIVSFGPPWKHPLGGHLYSVFPWAHLIFPDSALVEWRSAFKTDGARTIEESGLNRMTVRRFERLVAESPFVAGNFEAVPIKRLRYLANPLTREYTTSVVRCRLWPKNPLR